MKRRRVLAHAITPDGGTFDLVKDGTGFAIYSDDQILMTSHHIGSEVAMADVLIEDVEQRTAPRVLVGGLGLGHTLRASLACLPQDAEVVCVELIAATVDWHRGPLGPLADHAIDDPRVKLVIGDVTETIRNTTEDTLFDAILLDVDNGPIPMTVVGNWWLYANEGIRRTMEALKPDGVLVVWSADHDEPFAQRLRDAGFKTEVRRVSARTGQKRRRGATHVLFIGRRV